MANRFLLPAIVALLAACSSAESAGEGEKRPKVTYEHGVEDTYDILCALLSADGEKSADDLARLCHRRTEGNPFFLFSFQN